MSDMELLYKDDLDATQCEEPDCTHTAHDTEMVMSRACHPGAPQRFTYADGVLDMFCAVCGRNVVAIAVAERPLML